MAVSYEVNTHLLKDPAITLLGIYPREMKTRPCKNLYVNITSAKTVTVCNSQKLETMKCLSIGEWINCNIPFSMENSFFKIIYLFIYLTDRQPVREGTQAGGAGEEEAGSQQRSLMWGSIPGPRDHTPSQRQMLND